MNIEFTLPVLAICAMVYGITEIAKGYIRWNPIAIGWIVAAILVGAVAVIYPEDATLSFISGVVVGVGVLQGWYDRVRAKLAGKEYKG